MNHLSGRKIGILGGSFDPVHNGHLAIARAAYTDFDLDEVWFIPAGHSPNKNESGMTLPEYRAEMVALAVKPYPYFKMSTVEIEADSLDYFEEWKHPEIICEKAVVLVAVRDHWNMEDVKKKIHAIEQLFHAKIYPLSCDRFDAASRNIRQMIKKGEDTGQLLPYAVSQFIKEHHLYENEK